MAWSEPQQKAWHQSNGPNSKGQGKHGHFPAHSRQVPAAQPWNPQEPTPQVATAFPQSQKANTNGNNPATAANGNNANLLSVNRTLPGTAFGGGESHRGSGGPSSVSARSASDAGLDACSTSSTMADQAGMEGEHDPRRHHGGGGGSMLTTNPNRTRRGKGDGRNPEYESHPNADNVNSEGAQAGRNLLSMLRAGAQQPECHINRSEPQPLSTDEFQLWQMQAREDAEMGADVYNEETFGDDAGAKGWSFEENLAANERIYRLNQVRETREVEDAAVQQQMARLSSSIKHHADRAPAPLKEALLLVMQKGWHNVRWPRQYTALHMAAEWNCPELIVFLVTLGANPTARSAEGLTALDVAKRQGHRRCIEVLMQLASARSLEEVLVISARLSNSSMSHMAPGTQDRSFREVPHWAEEVPAARPPHMQPQHDFFERAPARVPVQHQQQIQQLHQYYAAAERAVAHGGVVPAGVPQAYPGAPDASMLPIPRFARISFAA